MRFDDTNPAKENAEFERVILEDLEMLQVRYDKLTHTSDHFDLIERYAEQMLRQGTAYVDDTDPEAMKQERDQKVNPKIGKIVNHFYFYFSIFFILIMLFFFS